MGADEWQSLMTSGSTDDGMADTDEGSLAQGRVVPEHEVLTAKAELAATQKKLKELEWRLAQMACAHAATAPQCGLCHKSISGSSAIGSGCACHFCHACLLDAVAQGSQSCVKCDAQIGDIKKDLEFDALLGVPTASQVSKKGKGAFADKATFAVARGHRRAVSIDGTGRKEHGNPPPEKAPPFSLAWLRWPGGKKD